MLTARNFFYSQKASFDACLSSGSNCISKNIFRKNHAINSMPLLCTHVFKFNKSFFVLPFRKINVEKYCQKNPGFQQTSELRPELDFLCVHMTCSFYTYSAVYLRTVSVALICVQCNLYMH